jgi:hypothetical protein
VAARIGRVAAVLFGAALAVYLARSVAYTPATTFHLRTVAGAPVTDAFAAFYYESSVFNFVDSLSRYAPGTLIRADAEGRITVPSRLGLKSAFDSQPRARIAFLYSPQLHNAPDGGLLGISRDGIVTIDHAAGVATLHDLGGNPEAWTRAIDHLYSAVRYDLWPGDDRRIVVPRGDLDPLVRAIGDELRALKERHGVEPPGLVRDLPRLETEWRALAP